ncbi:hypothetical protein GCM10009681_32110 [Luedemannella helvata]|uniref:Uncharacterized protein n=1 Tax=Luedemannella helvata TaxID=349315 RepID=A0ABP4WMY1_9ACTN
MAEVQHVAEEEGDRQHDDPEAADDEKRGGDPVHLPFHFPADAPDRRVRPPRVAPPRHNQARAAWVTAQVRTSPGAEVAGRRQGVW